MNPLQILIERLNQASLWEKTVRLSRNDFLAFKGSTDTHLYYIISGTLRAYFEDEAEENTIRLGYPGDIFAALDSFLSGQPTDLYIQALKKCELKAVSKKTFQQFLDSDPAHLSLWQQLMEQFVYQQMEREKDILISSPLKRYERVLQRSPRLFQEIPHKYIASYLRMTPETLSRLKNS